jgi:bacteriorhodopsin
MITEMDAPGMDQRQRSSWLRANRATLMVVGVVWLGMIGRELSQQRTPVFLIAMVPLFALARLGFYAYYSRRS